MHGTGRTLGIRARSGNLVRSRTRQRVLAVALAAATISVSTPTVVLPWAPAETAPASW